MSTSREYYKSVGEILDNMEGANWMVTEAQVEGIRMLCGIAQGSQRNHLRTVLNLAYEAGRKHDRVKYNEILDGIDENEYWLVELGG